MVDLSNIEVKRKPNIEKRVNSSDDIFSRNGTISKMFDVANTYSSMRSGNTESRLASIINLVMSFFV